MNASHANDPVMDDLRQRMRSKSLGEEHDDNDNVDHKPQSAVPLTKGRARSNSTTTTSHHSTTPWNKKKKIHPRSSLNNCSSSSSHHNDHSTDEGGVSVPLPPVTICRSFFFTGSCQYPSSSSTTTVATLGSPRGRKGAALMVSGCRHLHGCCSTNGTIQTNICLCHVVVGNGGDGKHTKPVMATIRKELQQCSDAEQDYYNQFGSSVSESFSVRDVDAMDMLHHFEVNVEMPPPSGTNHNSTRPLLPSERISEMITKLQLYSVSITYIVIDSVLVYDRYRNGLLFNTEQELITALLYPADRRRRGNSLEYHDDTPDATTIDHPISWNHIPDTILVHILTFLPDATVAPMSRVCQQWYSDIQSNSIIWRYMLDQRHWPHPATSSNQTYRDMFCQHYTVLRDMKALRYGFEALLDTRNTIKSSKEMTFRKFANTSKKHHSPTSPTNSICVRHWSPNRTLVAYDQDCTVRLFESQPGGEAGHTVLCKEIICQKFDPYRSTKKRNCVLQSVDLDEHSIAGIGKVKGEGHLEAFVLMVMSRDDFLLGDTNATTAAGSGGYSDDISKITVIDIGEAILHYLYSLDFVDGNLAHLLEFLTSGGSIGDINIRPTCTIVACGKGRFMLTLQLFIPNHLIVLNLNEVDEEGRLVDKRVYLFSSMVGAIVWSHEIDPFMNPQSGEWLVSCFRRQMLESYSTPICSFVVYESRSDVPFSRERYMLFGEIDSSGSVQSIMHLSLGKSFDVSSYDRWYIVHSSMILTSTAIVVASVIKEYPGYVNRVVVSFCDRSQFTQEPAVLHTRALCTDLEISGVDNFSRLCIIRDDYIAMICRFTTIVVIHVPSQQEIFRTELFERDTNPLIGYPRLISDGQGTITLSASHVGIVMTGCDVRQVIESSARTAGKQKKKPHLRNNQGYKKDGFRLGKK